MPRRPLRSVALGLAIARGHGGLRLGAGRGAGRQAQARRRPQHRADRGSAGPHHPRVGHRLEHVADVAVLLEPGLLRPAQGPGERGHRDPGAGRALVVAGQLPEPGVLPPQEREVARRQAVHLRRREVHLRRGPRGARDDRALPAQRAKGVVDQHRLDRGARALHGGVPPQAPPALAAAHAGLRLLAGPARPRAAQRAAPEVRRHRAVSPEGVAAGSAGGAGAQPRLLRARPALPRRHPLHHHPRAGHPPRRAPGRAARRLRAARDDEGDGRHRQERHPGARHHRDRAERQRQRADQPQARAVRQPARAQGGQPRAGPALVRQERAAGRGGRRRRAHAPADGLLGPGRAGSPDPGRLSRPGARQGGGQEAPRGGGLRAGQAAAARDGHPHLADLRGPGLLRGGPAPAGGRRGHRQAARYLGVVSRPGPARVPDRGQPHRGRLRRSGRVPGRELQVRVFPELH